MLANVLTLGRIALTPLFIIFLFLDRPWAMPAALVTFVVASVTDAFDGMVARKQGRVTKAGAFLDPLADKILVSSAFISFSVMGQVPYWMTALIIFRDLLVTGLRMLLLGRGFTLITSKVAKLKTAVQIGAAIFILAYLSLKAVAAMPSREFLIDFIENFRLVYYGALAVTFFTLYTGLTYLTGNREVLRQLFRQGTRRT